MFVNRMTRMRRAVLRSMRQQYHPSKNRVSGATSGNGGRLVAGGSCCTMLVASQYSEELLNRQPTMLQAADDVYLNVHYDDYEAGVLTQILSDVVVSSLDEFKRKLQAILLFLREDHRDTTTITGQESMDEDVNQFLFPLLDVRVLDDKENTMKPFRLNSRDGIPIENDLFEGKILLVLKPKQPWDDPYYDQACFSRNNSRFEIQIQGRFKNDPRQLYCGGELARKGEMQLNRAAKSLAQVLLGLLARVIGSNMNYSFGNTKTRAHISFPLLSVMDKLVVTRASSNDKAPRLGHDFIQFPFSPSSTENDNDHYHFNPEDTYTMSFSSSCVDLPSWRIVKPFHVDFSTFWGDSDMRLVIYESMRDDQGNDVERMQHNYLLTLQFRHVVENNEQAEKLGQATASSSLGMS